MQAEYMRQGDVNLQHKAKACRRIVLACALAFSLSTVPAIALADQTGTEVDQQTSTTVASENDDSKNFERQDSEKQQAGQQEITVQGGQLADIPVESTGKGADGQDESDDVSTAEVPTRVDLETNKPAYDEPTVTPTVDELSDTEEEQGDLKPATSTLPQPSVSYSAHVQDIGWQNAVENGTTAGTTGRSKRVEAVRITLRNADGTPVDGGVVYDAHVQDIGWQEYVSNGAVSGTTGQSKRVEAIRARLTGAIANDYDIWYRVHVQNIGWMAWTKDGSPAGTMGRSLRVEALQMQILAKDAATPQSADTAAGDSFRDNAHVAVGTHVQNIGWRGATTSNGDVAGTTGRSLRVEAVTARLDGCYESGGIEYGTHVQNVGWTDTSNNGAVSGTTGRGLRVEGVWFQLTGDIANSYDVWYRAHVANAGWLDWTKDGGHAGTSGLSTRVEALQVELVKKDGQAPGATSVSFVELPALTYSTYVQGKGWQGDVTSGATSGITGQSLRVEGLKASTSGNSASAGTVEYRSYMQNDGWQGWRLNGTQSGEPDGGKRTEAIEVRLTGVVGKLCNIWYRVHVQDVGWLGWAANGNPAGSTDLSLRVEAVQMQVRSKFDEDPGTQYQSFSSTKLGYQNPSYMYQLSSKSVRLVGSGPFAYRQESRLSPTATRDQALDTFMATARSYLGTAYKWDYALAPGVGTDCAGFVQSCMESVGMQTPYNSYEHRYNSWQDHNANNMRADSHIPHVALSDRRPGDLVFYSGHVGIYVGNDTIINAIPPKVQYDSMWRWNVLAIGRIFS